MSGPQPLATCGLCGQQQAGPPLTWSHQATARGPLWLCSGCTRENVRSIEGRLDSAWW